MLFYTEDIPQGSKDQVLEGLCPAQFSHLLAQTHLDQLTCEMLGVVSVFEEEKHHTGYQTSRFGEDPSYDNFVLTVQHFCHPMVHSKVAVFIYLYILYVYSINI